MNAVPPSLPSEGRWVWAWHGAAMLHRYDRTGQYANSGCGLHWPPSRTMVTTEPTQRCDVCRRQEERARREAAKKR